MIDTERRMSQPKSNLEFNVFLFALKITLNLRSDFTFNFVEKFI